MSKKPANVPKLQLLKIKVITASKIDDEWLKSIENTLIHNLTGIFISIKSERGETEDDRVLPEPPAECKGCKWLKNKECWHEEDYYAQDWGDQAGCHSKFNE